jgi:hypothetical protein
MKVTKVTWVSDETVGFYAHHPADDDKARYYATVAETVRRIEGEAVEAKKITGQPKSDYYFDHLRAMADELPANQYKVAIQYLTALADWFEADDPEPDFTPPAAADAIAAAEQRGEARGRLAERRAAEAYLQEGTYHALAQGIADGEHLRTAAGDDD